MKIVAYYYITPCNREIEYPLNRESLPAGTPVGSKHLKSSSSILNMIINECLS